MMCVASQNLLLCCISCLHNKSVVKQALHFSHLPYLRKKKNSPTVITFDKSWQQTEQIILNLDNYRSKTIIRSLNYSWHGQTQQGLKNEYRTTKLCSVITKQMSSYGALRTGQGFCQNRKQGLELKVTVWGSLDIYDALFHECQMTHSQCGNKVVLK